MYKILTFFLKENFHIQQPFNIICRCVPTFNENSILKLSSLLNQKSFKSPSIFFITTITLYQCSLLWNFYESSVFF